MPELDANDKAIIERRLHTLRKTTEPQVGDYVYFASGEIERISYDWGDVVQTSEGGSWYLGNGYLSFSGSLNQGTDKAMLRKTEQVCMGDFWIFHHNHRTAHNGVHAFDSFPLWKTMKEKPH
jgi:hypothetical protein